MAQLRGSAILPLLICIQILPTELGAQQQLSTRLTGLWALAHTDRNYCKEYEDGTLNRLSRAEASQAGLVRIKEKSMEWVYTPASCDVSKVEGGPTRYVAKAKCELRGTEYDSDITFSVGPTGQMSMGFSNGNFLFPETSNYVRCSAN